MIKKVKRHKKLFILFLVIIIAAVAGTILFINLRPGDTQTIESKKKNVFPLSKRTLTKSISATGTVESSKSKTVSANVNNLTIKKVNVSVGDEVKKGDILATFDKEDLQESLSDANENLADATSEANRSLSLAQQQLSDARSTYASEKAKAATSVSKAKKTLQTARKKVTSLKKQISSAGDAATKKALEEQLTKAREAVTQAKTAYDNAVSQQDNTNKQNKSSIQNAENSLENTTASNKKTIKEAQKQVEEAQETLDKCAVTAPISGVVTTISVESGDNYSGGSLMQIDDISSFTVSTTVDEYDISDVKVGQKAVILTEATGDEELQGKITFVAPSTNSSSDSSSASSGDAMGSGSSSASSSGGYEVKIAISDTNEKLKMGLTAKCSLLLEEATDVFAVPYDAIHQNSTGDKVIYVAKSETDTDNYSEVTVTAGMESDYYTEISGDGLEEGMLVVIPTDETQSPSGDSEEEKSNFGFGNKQGMPGGDMSSGRSFQGGNKGGSMPAGAPGGN